MMSGLTAAQQPQKPLVTYVASKLQLHLGIYFSMLNTGLHHVEHGSLKHVEHGVFIVLNTGSVVC